MADHRLQEGIKAVKGGNFERARRLFNQVVEEDPDSEQGWYWLGLTAPDQDKRIACFLRALEINPANLEIRDKLEQMGVPLPEAANLPLDQEETGPLPDVSARPASKLGERPRPVPEVFQPLDDEEDEGEQQAVLQSDSVLIPALTSDGEVPDDLFDPELVLEPGFARKPSLVGRLLPLLVILLIVACASTIYLSSQAGGLPFSLALAPASPTSSPTATRLPPTPTPSRTPQPTATATPITPSPTMTPTLSPLDRLTRLNQQLNQAASLAQAGLFNESILEWDQAIEAAPDEAELYYGRGRSYLEQVSRASQVPDDARDMLELAREDLTQAILLGPPRGAYYLTRYEILDWMSRLEIMRIKREPLLEQMLADLRMVEEYHLTTPFGDPNPGRVLVRLGRCQEAMSYLDQQVAADPGSFSPASLYTELARTYLCYGQLRGAILYANRAVALEPTPEREWLRAITLYNLGRYNEALSLLNDILEANPQAPGDRYYLRALVHIQRKEYELAQADLDLGAQRTPDHAQLAAYAAGLLAQQAGDQASADEQFNLAEETLGLDSYGPMLDRVRRELGLPPPERGIPVLPDAIVIYLDDEPETAQTPVALSEPGEIMFPISYDGSGAFHLPEGNSLGLHLYPPVPVNILYVDSLTLRLLGGAQAGLGELEAVLWDFNQATWEPIDLSVGENPVSGPNRFVNPQGDIYLRLENHSGAALAFDNLNLTLAIAGQQASSQP